MSKDISKRLYYMTTFDGGVYKYKRDSNAKFIMNMRKENLDYVLWVKDTLETFVGCTLQDRKDYNTDGCNRSQQVRLYSRQHPKLTKIRDRVYIGNKKVIDPHMLTMMDAEALAIIFMADGGTTLDERFKNPHGAISLHTKGFSHADNQALSKAIYDKLGIRTTVSRHGKYWYLRVKTADLQLFVDTVRPHVLPSFEYKLERIAPALQHRSAGDDIV
jgi:hypothetical protein